MASTTNREESVLSDNSDEEAHRAVEARTSHLCASRGTIQARGQDLPAKDATKFDSAREMLGLFRSLHKIPKVKPNIESMSDILSFSCATPSTMMRVDETGKASA